MSHTVTVTRTTTTTTTSAIILNTGYLKTYPGLLKLAQLILGIITVTILSLNFRNYFPSSPETYFFLVAVACLVGTFCLLAACLISLGTASLIAKTLYEVVYHCVAFLLYLTAGIYFEVDVNNRSRSYYSNADTYRIAGIIGIILAVLYLLSAVLAVKAYRGN